MRPRVSLITLGVRDLARARRFYEALGWHPWEIAHNSRWTLTADGGVRLG